MAAVSMIKEDKEISIPLLPALAAGPYDWTGGEFKNSRFMRELGQRVNRAQKGCVTAWGRFFMSMSQRAVRRIFVAVLDNESGDLFQSMS